MAFFKHTTFKFRLSFNQIKNKSRLESAAIIFMYKNEARLKTSKSKTVETLI